MALPMMFSSRAVTIVCVVVILMAGEACRHSEAFHEERRRTVRMTNNLGDGSDLTVHCKQKDEDLGEHILRVNEAYEFSFKTNFWGTTLYFCSFSWPGTCHRFDIFDMARDHDQCNECIWQIKPDRPCRLGKKSNVFDDCFDWHKDSCLANYTH